MNKAEAAKLLTFAAAFDQRTIGAADVEAWALALADVAWDDSTRSAVAAFYGAPEGSGTDSGTRRFIQPHNVRTGRTRIRHDRLARIVEPTPNTVEGVPYHEELRAIRRAIADGDIPDQAAVDQYTAWGGSMHQRYQESDTRLGRHGHGPREIA